MTKRLYIDCETTGLTPGVHAVIQIAAVAILNGEEVGVFNECGNIWPGQKVDPQALQANGRTMDEIAEFQPAAKLHENFTQFLRQYVESRNTTDKFHFLAYNSTFDNNHLREFFVRAGDRYFGSWFWTPDRCIMRRAAEVLEEERHLIPNFKLSSVAQYLGVLTGEEKLHDALADVRLTMAVDRELSLRAELRKAVAA